MSLADALPLNPPPCPDWQARWDKLTAGNSWLRRKIDRTRRLKEHEAYLHEYLPELLDVKNPGVVVDVGPGPGEFLELCRAIGHQIVGVDAKTGSGGMGDDYLEASRLMAQRQNIPVAYVGFHRWISNPGNSPMYGTVAAINSRGSIEQAMCKYMEGESHDRHHDCRRLAWTMTAGLAEAFQAIFEHSARMLRDGGVLMIYSNGSSNARAYDRLVREEAAKVGSLRLARYEVPQIHKWVKQ